MNYCWSTANGDLSFSLSLSLSASNFSKFEVLSHLGAPLLGLINDEGLLLEHKIVIRNQRYGLERVDAIKWTLFGLIELLWLVLLG